MDGIRDLRDEHGRLAYATRGSGAPLVFLGDLFFPIDAMDEDPLFAQFLDGLASFATLTVFDRRGVGFSDPIDDWGRPIFDTWATDVVRIIDGVVGAPATVFGTAILGGTIALRVAEIAPDRVERLLLMNAPGMARMRDTSAEDAVLRNIDGESELDFPGLISPSRVSDTAFTRWDARAGRRGASPADARRMWEAVFARGPNSLSGTVAVPTTMLLRDEAAFRYAVEGARQVVASIPGATVIPLSGVDLYPNVGDVDEVIHAVAEVMGTEGVGSGGQALLTVLFSDIVGSTEQAAAMGDAQWHGLLDLHDELVAKVVGRQGGHVVKHTGDGVLATFPLPSRALRAARGLREELSRIGLRVRIGVHTAEVERRGVDVSGAGVNLAARIMDQADRDEILVSQAVSAIVSAPEFSFTATGERRLKGFAGSYELFALDSPTTS